MTEFREILVLGLGRSGSNLLSSILRNIEGNAGFFEIFFERKAQGLQHYPEILKRVGVAIGADIEDPEAPAFLAARDADPVAFFEALSAASRAEGYQSMTCKIFARQISIPNLQALLRRPNLSVIFLTRNRIDRYISDAKGSITKRYVKDDTTELRPRLDVRNFLTKVFQQDRELDEMRRVVVESGVRLSHLRYETDLDQDEALRTANVTEALLAVGHEPVFRTTGTEKWTVKQDHNPDWRAKVENGFEAAAALAGLGLLDYAEDWPLADLPPRPAAVRAQVRDPRNDSLLDEGGYNLAFSSDPVITFTAIQYGRSFLAEWMVGPQSAFGSRKGVHFLKPTWTMETTDLKPLAATLRQAEACNPGHHFIAMHVSDLEARMYRAVGMTSVSGNPNLFTDERHFAFDAEPHPGLPMADALYVARLAPWKNHHLAAGLTAPLFVYGEPREDSEVRQFDALRSSFGQAGFVNHSLGRGSYHYLGRQELASVMSRAKVSLALSQEEGAMRAACECLLAGLPMVSVPSIGGRDLIFTPDTALIVDATPEAVRTGVEAMLARNLTRDEVRRATLARVLEERAKFLAAANRTVASFLGPMAPRISIEPLIDFTIRYVPLRNMIEKLA